VIGANIYVERRGKGIIIGNKGKLLKHIGTMAYGYRKAPGHKDIS
jgi:GTPase Era involved in 16S rRNA processing